MLISSDEIHPVVATKKAALFKIPGSDTPHTKVASKAKCSSVEIPAKFIVSLFL